MGIDFFRFLRGKNGKGQTIPTPCAELMEAAQEYQIRELCFWICANMVANAIGRCEFRTFRGDTEVFEREYYVWNYEPNVNQNSTEFLHKLVAKLYEENEALVFSTKRKGGGENLIIADGWQEPEEYPEKQNMYKSVQAGRTSYSKSFSENEVIHFRLNHVNMRPVVNGLYQSYYRLAAAAMKNYEYDHGQHWKVHVDQLAAGDENWKENFQKMIEAQVKPFFESNGAILPEFNGYTYTDVGAATKGDSRDIKNLIEDIFEFTARAFLIPAVLVNGKVEGTSDANTRFLTNCIDPLCDQMQEEINRKRYGYDEWKRGNYLRVDSSSIIHFDLFENAANVEKLVGSGAYTINDVRRAANQSRINEPWADAHYMTLNIAKVSETTRRLDGEKGGKGNE